MKVAILRFGSSLGRWHASCGLFYICLVIAWFVSTPKALPVSPPPDGGYPGANTAEGQSALLNLTTGTYNTAVGLFSLKSNTSGSFNTAIGAGALLADSADQNTATGFGALLSNTTGYSNTVNGALALLLNTSGAVNTAIGAGVLSQNTIGGGNTAIGAAALSNNIAGSGNTVLGYLAGSNLTSGNNNIDIGGNVVGVAGESNTVRIGNTDITDTYVSGISGATSSGGVGVFVSSNGKLGTLTSSGRFKEQLKPIGNASEAILALNPVSFRYKKEIDPQGISQFGLIPEEVEKVNPDLIVRDQEGKPYAVRYEQINAMLLNEFLKEHRTVEKQQLTIGQLQQDFAEQRKQIEALTARLQKVSMQVEKSESASKVVLNIP
jgi:Chaperone of endosialidase